MKKVAINRRNILKAGGAGLLATSLPGLSLASVPGDRKLIVVLLRGGMDGLSVVIPHGDPDYEKVRPNIAIKKPGEENGAFSLKSGFSLHPALKNMHAFWQENELLAVQAVSTADRTRSHFDAQDTLENGSSSASGARNGWLNRTIVAMQGASDTGLAVGKQVPLILRGEIQVQTWAPSKLPKSEGALLDQLERLYEIDPLFSSALQTARKSAAMTSSVMQGREGGKKRKKIRFSALCENAARLLKADTGPSIASLELGGWDTHRNQGFALNSPLKQLDEGMGKLKSELGPTWKKTAVVIISEFGRTAKENGTRGTDHGTAGVALLAGGAVNGGKIVGKWPGLSDNALFENRDLFPTTDLRSVLKAVLKDHLKIPDEELSANVFPKSQLAKPLKSIIL